MIRRMEEQRQLTGYDLFCARHRFGHLVPGVPAYGAFTLNWTDNSNNEDGFIIQKQNDPPTPNSTAPWIEEGRVGVDITTYDDSTIDLIRCYRVIAFNSVGNSTPSNVVCVGFVVPNAPGGLVVTIVITITP